MVHEMRKRGMRITRIAQEMRRLSLFFKLILPKTFSLPF
jgi:hypothetical protein